MQDEFRRNKFTFIEKLQDGSIGQAIIEKANEWDERINQNRARRKQRRAQRTARREMRRRERAERQQGSKPNNTTDTNANNEPKQE